MPPVFAQTTTTTEVPRVVGDPPAGWVVPVAGIALFVVVLLGGVWLARRARASD